MLRMNAGVISKMSGSGEQIIILDPFVSLEGEVGTQKRSCLSFRTNREVGLIRHIKLWPQRQSHD